MLTCLAWCGPSPVAGSKRDSFRKGRAAQEGVARKTRLIWAKVGIWGGCGEALIKRGHVVGLGYFLVLIPSKECGAIDCAINLGRTRGIVKVGPLGVPFIYHYQLPALT